MGKKKSWFHLVKRFFIADSVSKQDKDKKRKWIFFGKFKAKSRLASIAAPSPLRERKTPSEAEEEQSKRSLSVALATAAAAEKAVAAAKAAAEVVLLTGVPQFLGKKAAEIKRGRARQYSFGHRQLQGDHFTESRLRWEMKIPFQDLLWFQLTWQQLNSDGYSPSKNRFSLISSSSSTTPAIPSTSSGKLWQPPSYQQRSPSLKSLPGPIKSTRILKDHSFDSDCSFRTWDQPSTLR